MIYNVKVKKQANERISLLNANEYNTFIKATHASYVSYNPFLETKNYYCCRPYITFNESKYYSIRSFAKRELRLVADKTVAFISPSSKRTIFATLFLVGPLVSKKEITTIKNIFSYDDKQILFFQEKDIAIRVSKLITYTYDQFTEYKEKFQQELQNPESQLYHSNVFLPTVSVSLDKFRVML